MKKLHNRSDDPALEKKLREILDLLYSFYDQEIDLSLKRVERFLKQLGSPHLNLPAAIHIAGTNGKGSTLAILQSLLEGSDFTAHKMTSPHLVHPTERIVLNGEPITTAYLIELLEECLAVNRTEPITFFEIFTAASFLAMSRQKADFVLIETGMGGRLDATNIIPNPVLTIITAISKDHQKFLGNSLPAIAREKAGIMKAGVPCVVGHQTNEAVEAGILDVFHEISKDLSTEAPLCRDGSEWVIEPHKEHLLMRFNQEEFIVPHCNLLGTHQMHNQGAAIAAYRIIMGERFDASILSPDHENNPLWNVFWPGRLQKIETGAYADLITSGQELWLDGGHNDSAGVMLAEQAAKWQAENDRPLALIIAMVDRKNPAEFLIPLIPFCSQIIVTEIEDEASSFSMDELFDICSTLKCPNLEKAPNILEAIKSVANENSRILITGSLFLIGNILAENK